MSAAPATVSWRHPAVEVRASRIAGLGLFCTTPIATGTVLSRPGGEVVDAGVLAARAALAAVSPGAPAVQSVALDAERFLVPDETHPGPFGNHSCAPTTWWGRELELIAAGELPAGTELTCDYATFVITPDYLLRCMCQTMRCRGMITGEDWRIEQLQARYGTHWAPGAWLLVSAQGSRPGE